MAHRFELTDGGKRFRIDYDLSLPEYAQDVDTHAAPFKALNGLLSRLPGPLVARGGTQYASTSSALTPATGTMAYYAGPLRSGATLKPYYGFVDSGTTLDVYMQATAGARTTVVTGLTAGNGYAQPGGMCPIADENMIVAGPTVAGTGLGGRCIVLGGSAGSAYSTGTCTFTTGSQIVTGAGTTFASNLVGSYLVNTGDSAATKGYYRIVSVDSTTQLTLDRPFYGSNTGAAKAYAITPYAPYQTLSTGVFATASGVVEANVAAVAWNRVVLGDITQDSTASGPARKGNRLRWSGIAGSIEPFTGTPTHPFFGVWGFDPNGYLDLPASGGNILQIVPHGNAVVVFQERAMTVLYGTPMAVSAGSLDTTTTWGEFQLMNAGAAASTPMGVAFVDRVQGAMLWSGSGRPRSVSDKRITKTWFTGSSFLATVWTVGSYRELIMFKYGGSAGNVITYDAANDKWSTHVLSPDLSCLQPGRSDSGQYLVGFSGTNVVSLPNVIDNPGSATTDADGTAIGAGFRTGMVGPLDLLVRPDKVLTTYQCAAGASLTVGFSVGPFDDSGIGAPTRTLATTVGAGNVVTDVWDVTTSNRGQGVAVEVDTTAGGTLGVMYVYAIAVEGAVEGPVG